MEHVYSAIVRRTYPPGKSGPNAVQVRVYADRHGNWRNYYTREVEQVISVDVMFFGNPFATLRRG